MSQSTRNFKVYRSSAGSGKTWTLVKEYLRLALSSESPAYFKHILAITFTNKAAAELKQRILKGMNMLARGKGHKDFDPALSELLAKEIGIDEDRLQVRAQLAWKQMLHGYSDFAVSTIDSFVYKLVRAFAADLNLVSDFNVELDDARLNENAVDLLLSWVGEQKDITQRLLVFAESGIEEDKSWKIRDSLIATASTASSESAQPFLEKLNDLSPKHLAEAKDKLSQEIKLFETRIQETAVKARDSFYAMGFERLAFYRGLLTDYYDKLAGGKFDPPSEALKMRIRGDEFWCSKKEWLDLAKSCDEQVTAEFEEVAKLFDSDESALYERQKLIQKHWEATMILGVIKKAGEVWKEENDVVMVGEFNRAIKNIIKENPAPYVFEKIGEWYHHFLIDEFQDTAVIQWQNFLPLIENALAKGNESMLVGDSKQAIYRWRGGEVGQFDSLPRIFEPGTDSIAEVEAILHREYDSIQLGSNWRSGTAIVDFNNDLFELIKNHASIDLDGFEQHEQKAQSDFPGFVSVQKLVGDDVEERTDQLEDQLVSNIREALSDGFNQKDVAILTRNNKQVRRFTARLLDEGWNVITVDSLSIDNSPSVRLITSLASTMLNPRDTIAKSAAIGAWAELTDKFIEHFDLIQQANQGSHFELWPVLSANLDAGQLSTLPMYEFAEKIIADLNLASRDLAMVEQLLNCIASQGSPSQAEFIEWWKENSESVHVATPESTDGIKLMTVHKSKGLEFPVVIFPMLRSEIKVSAFWLEETDSGIPPVRVKGAFSKAENQGPQFVEERNKSMVDELNVLYVALTRPVQRLYWIYSTTDKTVTNPVADWAEQALSELGSTWTEEDMLQKGLKDKAIKGKKAEGSTDQTDFISQPVRENPDISLEVISDEMSMSESQHVGIAVHEILAEINSAEAVDADKLLGRKLPSFPPEYHATISSHVRRVLESDEMGKWFETPSLRERDLIDEKGRIQRPDRICVFPDELAIVDFKTGIVKEEHKVQVEDYVALLASIEQKPVKGYLLYTDTLEVVPV